MNNPVNLLWFSKKRRLQVVLQDEAAECGLACIAMISDYHGHQVDLNSLRQKFSVTLKGTTLEMLSSFSRELKFVTRALRLDLHELKELKTPCILHWNMSHFVVLKSVHKKGITILDPAKGERFVRMEEVNKLFTGVALELSPSHQFEIKDEKTKLGFFQLWQDIDGLAKSLTLLLTLSFALQIFAILSPLYMQLVIDEVIVTMDKSLLITLALGFLLLALIQVCVGVLRSVIILYLSNQLSIQVGANLFRHLLKLPMSFFERRHIGDIVSRFGSLETIREQLTTNVVEAVVDGVMVIGTLVMMWIYSVELTLVVLIALFLYALVRWAIFIPLKNATEEQIVAHAKKDSNFMETVRALQGVKLFGRETQRENLWHNYFAENLNAGIRVGKINIGFNAANQALFGIENIVVIYLGALAVMDSAFSAGMLFAFISYKTQFSTKAGGLIEKWLELKMVRLHLDRVADIALATIEDDTSSFDEFKPIVGEIEFRNLAYRYSENEAYIFEDLNFNIRSGESVAIIGPSGCGKSTLMKVMIGFLSPSHGSVLVDGQDVNQMGNSAFRKQIAAVLQDDVLLSGTIAENLTFFAEEASYDKIKEAARIAAIHEDIYSMPMKYHTLIGDMGSTLSGGQKQRLLLARAIYSEPKILFLDEATSSLDVRLERKVNTEIMDMKITRIFIAHRPETIRSADRILKLENRQIQDATKDYK